MKVIKSDKKIAEEEAKRKANENKEQKKRDYEHKKWKDSSFYPQVIGIIDKEIEKVNSNSAIPTDMSIEERGQYSLAMTIAYERLLKIRKVLSQDRD